MLTAPTLLAAAPVAVADAYAVPQGGTLSPAAPGVLANDTDAEGGTLTAVKVSDPLEGTLVLHANGSFTYVPAADYYGADSFTYQANDGALDSIPVTVYLSVRSLSGAPLAAADVYTAALNGTLVVAAPGVLGNDSDVDGHAPLSAVLVGGAAHGTVALSADGSFVYIPDAGWSGVDSFAYKASDGEQVVDHGTAWSYSGTSPGITAFSLHNDTHNFALSASRVAGTGVPLSATDAPTAHGLYVQLRVPTAAGGMVFDSTVELLRPSGRQLTWRR